MAMSQQHRNLLTRNRLRLVRELILNQEFYAILQSNHTLTYTMVEEIESVKTSQGRVGKLLDILPKRGGEAFPTFIDALKETHQDHLIMLLDPSHLPSAPLSSGRIISQPKDSESGADKLTPSATSSSTDRSSAAKSKDGVVPSGKQLQQPSDARSGNLSPRKNPSKEQQPSCEQAASKMTNVNTSGCSDVEEIIRFVDRLRNESFIYEKYPPDEGDEPGKMESLRNGRCVVFRNSLPKRRLYDPSFDDINLIEAFKKFGIKVENTFENKTEEDVRKLLQEEAETKTETETSAFILFMFAPGCDNYIITHDSKPVYIVEIVEIFKKSEALKGKPKVLIFHLTDPGPAKAHGPYDKTDSVAEPVPSLELSGLSLDPSADDLAVLKVEPSGVVEVHWLVSTLIVLMTKYSKKYDLATILKYVEVILKEQKYEVTLISRLKSGLYFTS